MQEQSDTDRNCRSLLSRRRGGRRILRPLGLPLLDFVRLVRGGVELDEPVEGLGEADAGLRRDRLLPLLHPLVAFPQERFGLGVFLLAQQGAAEQRLRVEGPPDVGLLLLADGQALAEERFGLGPFLLLEQAQTDLGEHAGQFGAVLGQCFASLGQLLLEQVGELGVLARLRVGVDQWRYRRSEARGTSSPLDGLLRAVGSLP